MKNPDPKKRKRCEECGGWMHIAYKTCPVCAYCDPVFPEKNEKTKFFPDEEKRTKVDDI